MDEDDPAHKLTLIDFTYPRRLTSAQVDLLTRYAALSAERQALVDDLIRHLGFADAIPRLDNA
jgi:hypothetical protein